jgi:UDP-N-acetylglucosamine--N-acetylmuramyl-(pentapeptide) pyrophosphoryl-undecaprenol N-acetylglucosamine transferase
VIISGGGTGGHIFPAVAIANALKKINAQTEILFVGANGRMEMEKVPAAGYKIEGLDISGIQRKFSLQNFLLPLKVIKSVLKARAIVKNFKPDVAVGVGGYASGPLLFAATGMKVPALIQEQNSFAGVTNKLLAKRVQRICVAYDGMEKYFPAEKIMMTGNPVRENMVEIKGKREEALRFFGLDQNKKTVLVIGGSLGARTINQSIEAGIDAFAKSGVQLIWQTGKAFYPQAQKRTAELKANGIGAYDFIQRMDLAYAAADVVISRAGASSVSELALVAKPAILVPSPNVAEDHQTKNALSLVNKEAAILVKDAEASAQLMQKCLELINDQGQQNKLVQNITKLALKDSAMIIAEEVYSLAKK